MIGSRLGCSAVADGWDCARCTAITNPASWWIRTRTCSTAMAAAVAQSARLGGSETVPAGRRAKEIAMRRKRLARLLRKLRAMRRSGPKRDQLLMRIGAAKTEAGRAFGFVHITLPKPGQEVTRETFTFSLDKIRLKQAELLGTRAGCIRIAQFRAKRSSSRFAISDAFTSCPRPSSYLSGSGSIRFLTTADNSVHDAMNCRKVLTVGG
jgi:hypothetical protein